MTLSLGSRLGSYEIADRIGVGGMGEVYRATDTNLKRQVAIKVLPEAVASDQERLARFQREAEVLASLNHPNIAQIHGLERSDGTTALVMELVEGPTLADRIAQGPIPVDEALQVARQVAEALEAAHELGIVHRDLKPANVKVRPDGTVKVLDFGLAKAMEPAAGVSSSLSMSPTITTPAMTQAGLILGTAAYMSPEQAKGRTVDRRTDVWAFGCVLYEMLTGRRAFEGEDVSDTLANVLKAEPDWTRLPEGLCPTLVHYLKRCLQKESKQRIPDIGTMRLALDGAFETGRPLAADAESVPGWQRPLPLAALAATGALLVAGLVAWSLWPRTGAGRIVRTTMAQPADQRIALGNNSPIVAISPDGSRVVHRLIIDDEPALAVRPLDSLEATVLHAGNDYTPFFSPDGAWVGFDDQEDGALKRVAVTGGPAITITDDVPGALRGATWGTGDTIVFGTARPSGLWQLRVDDGTPEPLTELDEEQGETNHEWPHLLPSEEAVLFTVRHEGDTAETAQVVVRRLDTGEQRELVRGSYGRYSQTGHLIYAYAGTLRAVAFDLDRLEVIGTPVAVLDGVATKPRSGAADMALALDGSLVYITGTAVESADDDRLLAFVDRDGKAQPLPAEPRQYARPRISPDGTRIAVEVVEGTGDSSATNVWIVDVESGVAEQLTFEGSLNQYPLWTQDGASVVFVSDRSETGQMLYRKPADNSGPAEPVAELDGQGVPTSISRNGILLFHQGGNGENMDLWTVPVDGSASPSMFLATPANERMGQFSPDGRWVAYVSDEPGQRRVYVRPYPATQAGLRRVSEDSGVFPLWSATGDALYFVTPRDQGPFMRAPVQTDQGFSRGPLERLFDVLAQGYITGPQVGEESPPHDVHPDGERFVFVQSGSEVAFDETERQLILVQNWFEDLRRQVPTD